MKNGESEHGDSGVLSNPLSFPRGGSFRWYYASLVNRGDNGNYWSLRSYDTTSSNYLYFSNTYLYPQNNAPRGYGFAMRHSKSFTTLINTSYSMNKSDSSSRDSGVLSDPLSFIRSGNFDWNGASLYYRGGSGVYWSLRSAGTTGSSSLGFNNTYLNPQYNNNRGNGFAVRCVSISSKSFTTLFNTSYSMKSSGQTSEDNRDSGLLSNPISFLRSGNINWSSASIGHRGGAGFCWSSRSHSTHDSNSLSLFDTDLNPQVNYNRSWGFAVRCEPHFSFLELSKDFLKVFRRGH